MRAAGKSPARESARPAAPAPRRGLPHEVRIIGGQWKRSKLPVGDAEGLRPTPDRVRETLFNWLGQDLDGWRCLDAFAGSGALGFEAASRGAGEVVLIERDRALARSLDAVKLRLGASAVRIENADAIAWMGRCPADAFDIVFFDPLFGIALAELALAAATRVVAPGGWVYLEAPEPYAPAAAEALGLSIHRQGRAGSVHFQLLQRSISNP